MTINARFQTVISLADSLFNTRFYDTYELIDRCCVALAIETIDLVPQDVTSFINSVSLNGITYQYKTILNILISENLIDLDCARTYSYQQCLKQEKKANCQQLCLDGINQFPESRAMFDLILLSLDGINEFLTNQKTGVDILFPKGNSDIWYQYNNENAVTSVYGLLTAEAISNCQRQSSSINILEIGAGTGSGTASIIASIGDRFKNYIYSDLGNTFLRRGRERFSDIPYITYKKLDINISLAKQGIDLDSIDILTGINVIHTAWNLEFTLQSFKQVLKPGGWVFFGEGSPPSATKTWKPDIIFGFLDGWWNVDITSTRPRAGFLTPTEWSRLLAKAGFVCIQALPGENYFQPHHCYGGVVMGMKPT